MKEIDDARHEIYHARQDVINATLEIDVAKKNMP